MDDVFNALNNELPYDRVSNAVNQSIQSYKDGEDKHLLGGQSDLDEKENTVDRFYDKLKEELSKVHGSDTNYEIENTGTSIGRFLFTNDKDMVEKASEALDPIAYISGVKSAVYETAITGNLKDRSDYKAIYDIADVVFKHILVQGIVYRKMNKETLKSLKNDFEKLDISIPQRFKEDNRKLVDVISSVSKEERTIKNGTFPVNMDYIGYILRDSISAISPVVSKDGKYYTRYGLRYKALRDIILKETSLIKELWNTGNLDLIKKQRPEIEKAWKTITSMDAKITAASDPFPFKTRNFLINLNTFYVEYCRDVEEDYGIHLKDYLSSSKRDLSQTSLIYNIAYTSIKSSTPDISKLKDKLYADSVIGSGNIDMSVTETKDIDIINYCGDLTVGEFYTYVEEFMKLTSKLDFLLKGCVKANVEIEDKTLSSILYATNTSREKVHEDITKLGYKLPIKNAIATLSIGVLADVMSVLEAMELTNAVDNLRKLQMYYLTTSLIKCFDGVIRSA